MEIFMRNIPFTVDEITLTLHLEKILHSPLFTPYAISPGLLINFKVTLFKDKRKRGYKHSGCGALTVPSHDIGAFFLSRFPQVQVDNRFIMFGKSSKPPREDILGEIQLMPYRNPHDILEKEARLANLSGQVSIGDVQFGWMCRDESFSIEWQWNPWDQRGQTDETLSWLTALNDPTSFNFSFETSLNLSFNDETREMIVKRTSGFDVQMISIRYSRIQSTETDTSGEPSIYLTLDSPPSFEKDHLLVGAQRIFGGSHVKRKKITYLNAEHKRVAPFTWNALRLVCSSRADLAEFNRMAELTGLKTYEGRRLVVQKQLFSTSILRRKDEWLCGQSMPWSVAFQCESLHRSLLLDTRELLDLRPSIDGLVATTSLDHVVQVLRQFGLYLRSLWTREYDDSVMGCFEHAKADISQSAVSPAPDTGLFRCLHATFTPTGMTLRGPFPDTSNRILRRYPNNHDRFLRVSFADEDRLKFRFDREVDGPGFIRDHVGGILREGFTLCGRKYQFLAYSQSALKEYTVWFVTPFPDRRNNLIDAEHIRASIGSEWPLDVRRNPARFAARLSQAFTATEPSVFVELDQVERIDDIERNGYCFSDGNGPMSQEMAEEIQRTLQIGSSRAGRMRRSPSVIQVRIQGAKGTLSIDPTLPGLKIGLRPSMVKFETRDRAEIEIARSFTKPGKLFLNRPLVIIMAGLGVPVDEFLRLQEDAVEQTETSSKTMKDAALLLETHGLGAAFAFPSTLRNLHKLGLDWDQGDDPKPYRIRDTFAKRCMQYAVNHVLREMKYRARIPVPDGWKLVGVIDVYNILRPTEVYACIVRGEDATPEYLYGPVVVSKSPTIHPGDVQMAFAIGEPPNGSPLRHLSNCVVFSQRGDRPLPNKLSGSDLDGDEYDLIFLPSLHPPKFYVPGDYPAAPRKKLDRDSTIEDVVDFVVDFINNDMLGIIATNFLLIADRSGIFHKDCLKLAELHSWAVDFPKGGVPVPFKEIPQPEIQVKPDWHAPELAVNQKADYYESQSVLGKLFRNIQLPKLPATGDGSRARQRRRMKDNARSLEEDLERLSLDSNSLNDPISVKLRRRLRPLVDLETSAGMTDAILKLFDYFVGELEHICLNYTLSRKATARLTEEEVFVGTIAAKSSQPRVRADTISKMREETTELVRGMRKELEGGEDVAASVWVNRSWTAWHISLTKQESFGAKSFGWIALRALFDGIKYIDDDHD